MSSKAPPFHALTAAEWLQVTQILTFSEVRVLYYLQTLCPYGDNQLELNLTKDANTLGIGKSTLAAALHSLAEHRYLEISQSRPSYKVRPCLVSPIARKAKNQQQPVDRSVRATASADRPSHQTEVRWDKRPSDGPNENIDLDRAREKTKTLKDFSYPAEETEKKFGGLVVSKAKQPTGDYWPDGPWLIEGKLDVAFRDAIAQHWVQQWGGSLQDRRLHVLRHFLKDFKNLALWWEWYAAEYRERFEKASEILAAGGNIEPEYRERLATNARALTAELPAELSPVAEGVTPRIEPVLPTAAEPDTCDRDSARLRLYNQWLHSDNPKVRAKALEAAHKETHYQLQTDESGLPVRIVEVQS